jgi:hypothetical protein
MRVGLIAPSPIVNVHYPRCVRRAIIIALVAKYVPGANVIVIGFGFAILLIVTATAQK